MIKLNIKRTNITVSCLETLVEGNVNSVFLEFTFSPEWDNLSRVVTFSNGTSKISVALSENTCAIPWEMLSCPGELLLAVRGASVGDGGYFIICTENASLGKVIESLADDNANAPEDATPGVIDALLADVAELKSGSEGGHTPVKGTDYWTDADKAEIISETEQAISDVFASKSELPTKTSDLANDSGFLNESEIFAATYGTTTYAEIAAAYNAGKKVQVVRKVAGSEYIYDLTLLNATNARFGQLSNAYLYTCSCTSEDAWSRADTLMTDIVRMSDLTQLQTKSITDAGGYFTSDDVEGALQEIGSTLDRLESTINSIM